MYRLFFAATLLFLFSSCSNKKKETAAPMAVMAYYAGDANGIDSFEVEKCTHIIFSF